MLTVLLVSEDHYKSVRIGRMIEWEQAGMEFFPVGQALSSYKLIERLFPDIMLIDISTMRFTNVSLIQTVLEQCGCTPSIILLRSSSPGSRSAASIPEAMNVVAEFDDNNLTPENLNAALKTATFAMEWRAPQQAGAQDIIRRLTHDEKPYRYLSLLLVKVEQEVLPDPQGCIREIMAILNENYGGRCYLNTEKMFCVTVYCVDEAGRHMSQQVLDTLIARIKSVLRNRFYSRVSIYKGRKISPSVLAKEYEQLLELKDQRYYFREDETISVSGGYRSHAFDYLSAARNLQDLFFSLLAGNIDRVTSETEALFHKQIAHSFSGIGRVYVREVLDSFLSFLTHSAHIQDQDLTPHTEFVCFEDEAIYYTARFSAMMKDRQPVNTKLYDACLEISKQYHQNLALDDIAEKIGVSGSYLSKLFKSCFCTGFSAYLNWWRIYEARLLLLFTDASAGEIAAQVGYSNAQYFNQIFRRFMGITPGYYRSHRRGHGAERKNV